MLGARCEACEEAVKEAGEAGGGELLSHNTLVTMCGSPEGC